MNVDEDDYPEVDISDWEFGDSEPLGARPKHWVFDPDDRQWLFKAVTMQDHADGVSFPKGEDWAEKIATELAGLLGLPAARAEFATDGHEPGIVSLDMRAGRDLVHGNEVLFALDPTYHLSGRQEVAGYTLDAIIRALEAEGVVPPPGGAEGPGTASGWFAGYLVLDAWVANTDRHHANWGILVDPAGEAPAALAPTYDHASSLGFQLDERAHHRYVCGISPHHTIATYAARGRCRPMAGQPHLVEVAAEAASRTGTASWWARQLAEISSQQVRGVIGRVPPARMSQPARMFCEMLLEENRRRIHAALATD